MTGGDTVDEPLGEERMALAELVSRVVERGVVITGDLVISVADVDLLYLRLDVLLATVDRVRALPELEKNVCNRA